MKLSWHRKSFWHWICFDEDSRPGTWGSRDQPYASLEIGKNEIRTYCLWMPYNYNDPLYRTDAKNLWGFYSRDAEYRARRVTEMFLEAFERSAQKALSRCSELAILT